MTKSDSWARNVPDKEAALITTIRILAGVLLSTLALALLLMAATTPFLLQKDLEENRSIHRAFERTAVYVSSYASGEGELPLELSTWAARQGPEWFWSEIRLDQGSCQQQGFQKEQGDAFVLLLWRGEWFDCFAFRVDIPRSTLRLWI